MDRFEDLYMASLWANFEAMAAENIGVPALVEADPNPGSCMTFWQAKCFLMQTLGINVDKRHLILIIQEGIDAHDEQIGVIIPSTGTPPNVKNANDPSVFASATPGEETTAGPRRVPHVPKPAPVPIPQLIALEKMPAHRKDAARIATGAEPAPAPAPSSSIGAGVPTHIGPTGYITKSQFAHMLLNIKAAEGITFSTIVSKMYHALDSTRRGYVDATSLAAAARSCGASISAKAPMYFSACDDYGIGKISTTQVSVLLQEGAAVLTGAD